MDVGYGFIVNSCINIINMYINIYIYIYIYNAKTKIATIYFDIKNAFDVGESNLIRTI